MLALSRSLAMVTLILASTCSLHAQFADPVDLTYPRGGFRDVEMADLDGDGDLDLLAPHNDFFSESELAWYPNRGSGVFEKPITLYTGFNAAWDGEIADLDGDGDLDVLGAYPSVATIAWFANDGAGNFGAAQIVADTMMNCRAVHPADLDGDGDLDLITVYDEAGIFDTYSKIIRFENLGGGVYGPPIVVYDVDIEDPTDVNAADIDDDGDLDIISASINSDDVAWYENLGGGLFGPKNLLTTALIGARDVEVGDMNGDSLPDLIVASVGDDRVSWLENVGAGSSFILHRLSTPNSSVDDCMDVTVGDLDGDGDLDVTAALLDENAIHTFRNLGGGNFTAFTAVTERAFGGHAVAIGDVDGDLIPDLVSGSQNDSKLAWYRNFGSGVFGVDRPVNAVAAGVSSLEPVDLDGDGDLDLLSTSSLDDKLAFYPNEGGVFGSQQILSLDIFLATEVVAADIDGDSLVDLAVIGEQTLRVLWNEGGGNFADSMIYANLDRAKSVVVADIDGDLIPDLVTTSWFDSRVAWYQNQGGRDFGGQTIIATPGGPHALDAADVDADGDVDLFVGNEFSDRILYYENLGGGSFAAASIIADGVNGTFDLILADVNGDSLLDPVWIGLYAGEVSYAPNLGASTFGPEVLVKTFYNPINVRAADPDGDGDIDLIVSVFGENRFVALINDGGRVFTNKVTLLSVYENPSVSLPADFDGDGDDDIVLGFKNTITYLENLRIDLPDCMTSAAPTGVNSVVGATGVTVSWDAVPGTVACQVKGRPLGASSFASMAPIIGDEPTTAFVPPGALDPGLSYEWRVRCACSLSPPSITPFSLLDTFAVPLLRPIAALELGGGLLPNPAANWTQVDGVGATDRVQIFDAMGRLVMTGASGGSTLDLGALPQGAYYVRIESVERPDRTVGTLFIQR